MTTSDPGQPDEQSGAQQPDPGAESTAQWGAGGAPDSAAQPGYPPPTYPPTQGYPAPGSAPQPGSPPPGYPPQSYPPPQGFPPQGYGAMPPAPPGSPDAQGRLYDPGSELSLPPGTELASIGRRIGAYFLAIPLAIVTLFIGYAVWGVIVWGKGTTPAMQVLGMRCYVPTQNRVATWGNMALREVVGRVLVEGIVPFANIVSFIIFLTNKRRQSLHDMIGSTVVLYDPNKRLTS